MTVIEDNPTERGGVNPSGPLRWQNLRCCASVEQTFGTGLVLPAGFDTMENSGE